MHHRVTLPWRRIRSNAIVPPREQAEKGTKKNAGGVSTPRGETSLPGSEGEWGKSGREEVVDARAASLSLVVGRDAVVVVRVPVDIDIRIVVRTGEQIGVTAGVMVFVLDTISDERRCGRAKIQVVNGLNHFEGYPFAWQGHVIGIHNGSDSFAGRRELRAIIPSSDGGMIRVLVFDLSSLMRSYLQRMARGERPGRGPLTAREADVAKLIAEGHTSQEIAACLTISPKTVERHRANILEKLELRDRVDLTRYAIRVGLIEP